MIVVDVLKLNNAICKLMQDGVKSVGIFQTNNHDVVFQCAEHSQPKILVEGLGDKDGY